MSHTNTDPLDKALDWQVNLLVRQAIIQNISDTKELKITQEMIAEARAEAKQAINNYINSRIRDALKQVESISHPPSGKEYWFVDGTFENTLFGALRKVNELNQVKGDTNA